jgi:hypothetical protein
MGWNPFTNSSNRKAEPSVDAQIGRIIGRDASGGVRNNPNYGAFSRVNDDIATIINSRSMVSRAIQC